MAIQKANLSINFGQGLDTKTDPWQVSPGRFLRLVNSQFDKGGQLEKRNGFGELTEIDDETATFLTTFNGNLTAIGSTLNAYISGSDTWVNKGTIQPCQLTALPLVRNSLSQSQCDAAVAPNGLVCVAYTEAGTADSTTLLPPPVYRYAIVDSMTGQNVVAPTLLTATTGRPAGGPRVFVLRNHFVIVYPTLHTGTYSLQYTAININQPTSVVGPIDITDQYQPATGTVAWDGVVTNNALYLAWNGTDIGDALRLTYIDSTLTQHATVVYATIQSTLVTITADVSGATSNLWVFAYDDGSGDAFLTIQNPQLVEVLAPTSITIAADLVNMTAIAKDSICTLFVEVQSTLLYDVTVERNSVISYSFNASGTGTASGTLGTAIGLGSKAFVIDDVIYVIANYASELQSTYFLMGMPIGTNTQGYVVAKLAYGNGAGYFTGGLPSVTVESKTALLSYLIKDTIIPVNKSQTALSSSGVYSSLGVNLASFTLGTDSVISTEIAGSLQLSGGFMWSYDGTIPVESGFFLYPEYIEATGVASSIDSSVDRVSGSPVLHNVTTTDLQIGMHVTGTGIPANTVVVDISSGGSTVTMSKNATSTAVGGTVTFTGSVTDQHYFYVATYEWTDNQGNIVRSAPSVPFSITTSGDTYVKVEIPYLNLTYKHNAVIVLYRWSAAQQTYYQVTSITEPIINYSNLTYVTFIDVKSDSQIVGNNILYTTGGILENISPSAIDTMALFQSRLFYVPSENKNTLGFSQVVLPSTSVDMSDLLTIFVAPTTSAQVNTGAIRVLCPMDDKLIIFKKDAIYYINGTGPDATGANNQYSEPTGITTSVGSENHNSLVIIPSGLMFQSDKGIWLLGRDLSTKYIGAEVEQYTQDATVLSAINIPQTNQVRFTLDSGITLMFDYYYNQWGTFEGISAVSSTLYQNKHTFLNSLGQVFQETPGKYLDGSSPVLMSFKTSWLNLAGLQGFERAYFFYLLGRYLSPHKLTVTIAYDYNDSPTQSNVIAPDNFNPTYGEASGPYGSGSPYGGNSDVEQWRIFFQTGKCQAFQLGIMESYDSSYGVTAGAGFTLSGLDVIVGIKGNYPRLKPSRSVG